MTHETMHNLKRAIEAALDECMPVCDIQALVPEVKAEWERDQAYFAQCGQSLVGENGDAA